MNGPNISVERRYRWRALALLSFFSVFGLGCPNGPSGDGNGAEQPLPGEGGTLVVFQVDLGDAGIIEVVGGDPPTSCVNAVFTGEIPEDAATGTVSVSPANVELLPADGDNLQAMIPQAQISIYIAPADSADPTDDEYEVLSFSAVNDETGQVRLDGATASLSTETIELLVGGNYLLCLRLVANFEGTAEVREVEITLGADAGSTDCGESSDECDDGNPCTGDDRCLDGTCAGDPVDDCTLCDQDSDCDDDDPCTDDSCGPAGVCGNTDNALACDDGDPCTADDRCLDGTCSGDSVERCVSCDQDSDCDDNDPCTDNSCGPAGTCVSTDNALDCNDGDPCTDDDRCLAGTCTGSPVELCTLCDQESDCDDTNPCTDDSCGPAGTCVNTDNALDCNDGDPCTEDDVCSNGECAGTMISGCACEIDSDCDNGLYCDGQESCDSQQTCQPGAAVDCDDQVDCTADSCNEETDTCDHGGDDVACDDELYCTGEESCDPELGCVSAGSPCADAQICDEANQTCVDCTDDSQCDDGNDCTDEVCDLSSGDCVYTNLSDGTACGDPSDTECGDPDTCMAGVCIGNNELDGTACGDGSDPDCDNPDTCDGSGNCNANNEPDGTACPDDGNDCTDDVCNAVECTHPNSAAGTVCGDGGDTDCDNPDTCDGSGNCNANNEPDGTGCTDDGTDCTTDSCDNATCVHQPDDSACDDGNECTDDTCDPALGCQHDAVANVSLTINIDPSETGTVQLDPAGGEYKCGTEVTLTATPNEGWFFESWGQDASGTDNPLVLTMETDTTVTAFFTDLNGSWSFDRVVTASEGATFNCQNPDPGTQDSTTAVITQTGSEVSFTLSYTSDADDDNLIDESPGELWFELIPFDCEPGWPFELVFASGAVSGNTISASISNDTDEDYCLCLFITNATLEGTVIDEAGTIQGTMSVTLFRQCGQFGTDLCSVDYSFTATRQ